MVYELTPDAIELGLDAALLLPASDGGEDLFRTPSASAVRVPIGPTAPRRRFGPARHGMVSSWSLFFQGGTHAEASLYHGASVGLIGRPPGGVQLERDVIADALPDGGALGIGPGIGPGIAQRVAFGVTVLT